MILNKAVSNGCVKALLNTEIIELESEGGKVKVHFQLTVPPNFLTVWFMLSGGQHRADFYQEAVFAKRMANRYMMKTIKPMLRDCLWQVISLKNQADRLH
jgi:hypothetical protein